MSDRKVGTGLEGCGKSTKKFEQVEKKTNENRPVLFAMKNYSLMLEQIENWSQKYDIPRKQFAVCGFNQFNDAAIKAYTNPEEPSIIPNGVRFIFCSQATMQKNNHLMFLNEDLKHVKYGEIVVDEWDINMIIPSLDYELSKIGIVEEKRKIEQMRLKWIGKHYTKTDVLRVKRKRLNHDKGFVIASWVQDCEFPITFLTSEVLASMILESIGFDKYHIGKTEFDDCTVRVWSHPDIGGTWIDKMNQSLAWNRLNYDLIISDKIHSYYEKDIESLNVTVLSHMGVRGLNNWRNSKILTILSHIPSQVISQLQDTFHYFNIDMSYNEVSSLFYRDRLCQAVGRSLGYRGNKVADVIMPKSLLDQISNLNTFPYNIDNTWKFEFDGLDEILKRTKIAKNNKTQKNKNEKVNKDPVTYTFLEDYFYEKNDSILTAEEIKNYLLKHNILNLNENGALPASKVAIYFGKDFSVKRINKKNTRVLKGLAFKK